MLNLALLGAGAVGSPLDFRCVTAQQEHFGRHQRAELFQPVLTNTSGPPACQTLQTTFQKALDRAYKNSRGSPKDKYHRILGKESWRAVGKEGYDHSLGMPRTMARIVESITFMVEEILANNVEGGVMETGVFTGFQSMAIAAAFKAHGVSDRDQWLCDSFNGLPRADPRYHADRGSAFHKLKRHELGGPAFTQANFEAVGLRDVVRQHWEVGFFNDTMPGLIPRVPKLSMLRLDGDMYQSTWEVLVAMYPKLQVGGFLVMDDYDLAPFRKAVHQFRKKYGITEVIVSPKVPVFNKKKLPNQGNYWRVERRVTIPLADIQETFLHAKSTLAAPTRRR